jgi:hypothetical protein
MTRQPLGMLFLIKLVIYCEFLRILGIFCRELCSVWGVSVLLFFRAAFLCKWKFSSMLQSNLELPLNTKRCIVISRSCYQNLVIFGNIGYELWIFDSQPPNFTPSFYAYSFRVPAYLAPCANGCPIFHRIEDQTYPFYSLKSCGRFETFSSGSCMQRSFIAVRILSLCMCSHLVLTFVTYSRCLPPYPRPLMRRCGLTWSASRRVVSYTFVGHPKGLRVCRVSRVLGTWAHEHRPIASLGSEGEDPRVPDTSYLGRVGGEGTRVELGWHRAKGCFGSARNFLWEACWFGR